MSNRKNIAIVVWSEIVNESGLSGNNVALMLLKTYLDKRMYRERERCPYLSLVLTTLNEHCLSVAICEQKLVLMISFNHFIKALFFQEEYLSILVALI